MTNSANKTVRDHVTVSLLGITSIPDPLQIYTTFQWFILDSIAENLIRYDHTSGRFSPALAESWTVQGDRVTFKLSQNIRFSDGSALTPEDVLASFHRVMAKKVSTHFDIWNYVTSIKLQGSDIEIDYNGDKESLFLFLSSPEASVWSKSDLQAEPFSPTKYSGFYRLIRLTPDGLLLEKNRYSVRSGDFPNAPRTVQINGKLGRWHTIQAIRKGEIDAFIGDYIPFSTFLDTHSKVEYLKSTPLVFVHLVAMKKTKVLAFDPKVLEAIWSLQDKNKLLIPAYSILPPGQEGSTTKSETLDSLALKRPHNPSAVVKIGTLSGYISQEFQDKVIAAAAPNLKIEAVPLEPDEFFSALEQPENAPFDYLMIGYVASDKFPFVQLKLITSIRDLNLDIPKGEIAPDEKIKRLKRIQTDLLSDQEIIPLFYVPSVIAYRSDMDIGNQPTTDAELQFWRINENLKTN